MKEYTHISPSVVLETTIMLLSCHLVQEIIWIRLLSRWVSDYQDVERKGKNHSYTEASLCLVVLWRGS